MMPDGVDRALLDAELALEQLPPGSPWRPPADVLHGVAHAMLGATASATDVLTAAVADVRGATEPAALAHAELALLAARQGAWNEAGQAARAAQALVEEAGLGDYSSSALVYVAAARVAMHEGRHEDARASLASAHRLRPLLDSGLPWLTVQVGLELARCASRARRSLAPPAPFSPKRNRSSSSVRTWASWSRMRVSCGS